MRQLDPPMGLIDPNRDLRRSGNEDRIRIRRFHLK